MLPLLGTFSACFLASIEWAYTYMKRWRRNTVSPSFDMKWQSNLTIKRCDSTAYIRKIYLMNSFQRYDWMKLMSSTHTIRKHCRTPLIQFLSVNWFRFSNILQTHIMFVIWYFLLFLTKLLICHEVDKALWINHLIESIK